MLGPILIVAVLLVIIPVGVIMTGVVVAAILGRFLGKDVDDQYEGTEYYALSRVYDDSRAAD